MKRILRGDDVLTLIKVFTVEPENQQRLVDLASRDHGGGDEQATGLRVSQTAQESRWDRGC